MFFLHEIWFCNHFTQLEIFFFEKSEKNILERNVSVKDDCCCKSNRNIASRRRMEFPMMKLSWTYLVISVARVGGKTDHPPIEMPLMIKIITTKVTFFSVSVSLSMFASNSMRVQQTNINAQVGVLGPLKSNFCHSIYMHTVARIHDKTKSS